MASFIFVIAMRLVAFDEQGLERFLALHHWAAQPGSCFRLAGITTSRILKFFLGEGLISGERFEGPRQC
jgi:hypothetical protein